MGTIELRQYVVESSSMEMVSWSPAKLEDRGGDAGDFKSAKM